VSDDEAWSALRDAFAGDDSATAAWSQTAPDIKARCISYVAQAESESDRQGRARNVARLAAAGPIHEVGAGLPELPGHLRGFLGAAGLEGPHGT
jgi:hypothetical protein